MLMNILDKSLSNFSKVYKFGMVDNDSSIYNHISSSYSYDSVYLGMTLYEDDYLVLVSDIGKYIINCLHLIPGIVTFSINVYQFNPITYILRIYKEETFSWEMIDEFITMFNENSIEDYYNFIKFYNNHLIVNNVLKYKFYNNRIFDLYFPKIILRNCCSLHSVKLRNNSMIFYRYTEHIKQNFIKRKYFKLVKRLLHEYSDISEINIFRNRIMMNFREQIPFPNLRKDVILEVIAHSLNHQYVLNEIEDDD